MGAMGFVLAALARPQLMELSQALAAAETLEPQESEALSEAAELRSTKAQK
jgi:hypothetical protein